MGNAGQGRSRHALAQDGGSAGRNRAAYPVVTVDVVGDRDEHLARIEVVQPILEAGDPGVVGSDQIVARQDGKEIA